MRELNHFLNSLPPRPERYCVWVEERAAGRTRLVQLWMDPSMERFESDDDRQEVVSAGQEEPPPAPAHSAARAGSLSGSRYLFF